METIPNKPAYVAKLRKQDKKFKKINVEKLRDIVHPKKPMKKIELIK